MPRFDDLAAFVAVVRASSFTRAAAQLGVSQSALSQTIRALEKRLDLKLLNRTTRSVSPTEAGARLYETVAQRFSDIEAELSILGELRARAAGTVRISASEHAVRTLVWPRLKDWLPAYPDIRVEISGDNRFIDIVADRYDIGVRLGGDIAKDMIAVRMAPDMRMLAVGSPAYLATHGRPATPQQLTAHECINLRLPTHGGLMPWEFKRRGRSMNVHVSGRLVFSNGDYVLAAAVAGYGLAWVPEDMAAPHLATGKLERLLADWTVTFPGYHLYYPSRRASPALALVVQALRLPN